MRACPVMSETNFTGFNSGQRHKETENWPACRQAGGSPPAWPPLATADGGQEFLLGAPFFSRFLPQKRVKFVLRKGAGVVDRTRLESVRSRKVTAGSNPALSAEVL